MEGLKTGRIVYLVLSTAMVLEIARRRTTGESIKNRLNEGTWPTGAQAHVGADVQVGTVVPAMVVKVNPNESTVINCKAMLDGSDEYWARDVPYDQSGEPGTWGWMFEGQDKRYDATKAR